MRRRLAVTLGDPRGIGPEVVAAALQDELDADAITVIGPAHQLTPFGRFHTIAVDPEPVMDPATAPPEVAGRLAGRAIERAAAMALDGAVDAIVTGPVEKRALHEAGFRYPGQTEWLGHLAGAEVAMLLQTGALRVVLLTTHLPLRDVPERLTVSSVEHTGRIALAALREWWGIATPRLALCALNPHAGEGGLFGDEDDRILAPAAQALGAVGPLPADTVFVRALRGEFDCVLTPVHDVGMTAVKVAGFGTGVNVTLGLPFVRTAPDHGTAFDIAGTGRADAGSMRAALELAGTLAAGGRAG